MYHFNVIMYYSKILIMINSVYGLFVMFCALENSYSAQTRFSNQSPELGIILSVTAQVSANVI